DVGIGAGDAVAKFLGQHRERTHEGAADAENVDMHGCPLQCPARRPSGTARGCRKLRGRLAQRRAGNGPPAQAQRPNVGSVAGRRKLIYAETTAVSTDHYKNRRLTMRYAHPRTEG